ncbi:MAG: alpha/beta hydrolase [Succinivibrio sp.]
MRKLTFLTLGLTVFLLNGHLAMANDYKDNPYSLVYDNAIAKNVEGEVNIHKVSYEHRGIKRVANVYTPSGYKADGEYKAIVVAHPNGGVKEQVAGMYAELLAKEGYITIAFDAAYQGESGGEPRNTDIPSSRIEDIFAAADFIQKYPGVNPKALGLLGICGGGGYSLAAAKTDKRFKAVATIAMFNSGRVRRNGYLDGQIDSIQQRLNEAAYAREKQALTGEVEYFKAPDPNIPIEEINKIPTDLYREGMIYYLKEYAHPNSTFAYTKASLLELMTFDSEDHLDLLTTPLLMVTGSKADSKYMTDDAFLKAISCKDKEKFVVDGATHITLYYKDEYVTKVKDKLKEFFNKRI